MCNISEGYQVSVPYSKSTLTVKAVTRKYNRDCYIVECSKCSKDSELWSHELIVSDFGSNFSIPCGCTKQPKWREYQYEILVKRMCVEKDYTFLGWGSDYKGAQTNIKLLDNKEGDYWETTKVYKLLRGHGNPLKASRALKKKNTKSLADCKKDFINSGWSEDTEFKIVGRNGKEVFFKYKCPVCSSAEYSIAGLCDGWFSARSGTLSRNQKSCRCSPNYEYTYEQRLFYVKKVLKKVQPTYKFINLSGGSSRDKISYLCNKGHKGEVSVNRIKTLSCPSCAEIGELYGYYPLRSEELDTLYFIKLFNHSESFIKIGRSFEIDNRFNYFKRFYDLEILKLEVNKHEYVFEKEQKIHKLLRESGLKYTPSIKFGGSVRECFKEEAILLLD